MVVTGAMLMIVTVQWRYRSPLERLYVPIKESFKDNGIFLLPYLPWVNLENSPVIITFHYMIKNQYKKQKYLISLNLWWSQLKKKLIEIKRFLILLLRDHKMTTFDYVTGCICLCWLKYINKECQKICLVALPNKSSNKSQIILKCSWDIEA